MTAANAEMPSAMASTTSTVRARSCQKSRIALRQSVVISNQSHPQITQTELNNLCHLWVDLPVGDFDLAIDYARDVGFVSGDDDRDTAVRHVTKEIENFSCRDGIEISGGLI